MLLYNFRELLFRFGSLIAARLPHPLSELMRFLIQLVILPDQLPHLRIIGWWRPAKRVRSGWDADRTTRAAPEAAESPPSRASAKTSAAQTARRGEVKPVSFRLRARVIAGTEIASPRRAFRAGCISRRRLPSLRSRGGFRGRPIGGAVSGLLGADSGQKKA